MTEIYCDMSANKVYDICAWACIILHENERHEYSGHFSTLELPPHGELYAIVMALEKLSAFDARNVIIYTDANNIVIDFEKAKSNDEPKFKREYGELFNILSQYRLKYNIDIIKISHNENPAHEIAYAEYKSAIKDMEPSEGFEHEEYAAYKKNQSKEKSPASLQKIVNKCMPNLKKEEIRFDAFLTETLDKCTKYEFFHRLLSTKGVSLLKINDQINKRYPKSAFHHQTGEKKVHLAYAKALQGSSFCVCDHRGTFLVFYYNSLPKRATIIK